MRYKFYTSIFLIFIAFLLTNTAQGQEPVKKQLTKEEVLNLSYEQLLNMPFEELINLANIVGVSADELLQMILNKQVSSASKTNERALNSPLSTTVITKEELEASGALSIPEALRLVPGMIVREKTPGNFDIHIRGNDNVPPKNMYIYTEDAMSLIMIDGRPVYNYSFGGTFWETLPIDINDVERIEVIRGPSSALYGPNAVAGVINIITKQPDSNKIKASGNVQVGSGNVKIVNAGITGGVNKFKYRFSGNYQYQERFNKDFYVFDINQRLSYAQLDTLTNYWSPFPQQVKTLAYENLQEGIKDPALGTDKYGINAFLFYDLNDKVHLNLSTGYQESDVVSTTLGNYAVPFTGRSSATKYIDFKAKVYGFDFQTNYMFGKQNVSKGSTGYIIDPTNFNTQLEYEYKLNNLTLRPGISYSQTIYSDEGYVNAAAHEGFLNGDRKLTDLAGFLRADYRPIDDLRLIAALRADKYDIPNKTYFTYQFIGTYNIMENKIIRFVYSRANRGPFIVDSHGNYNWEVIDNFYDLKWNGNQNLKLPVMDMFELGYRTKIGQHLLIDFEAFVIKTKDFSYFMPDSMVIKTNWMQVFQGAPSPINHIEGFINYHNFEMESVQKGLTCNISIAVNRKLNFRIFGTLQETKLNNFYPLTIWQNFETMLKPVSVDGFRLKQNPTDLAFAGYLATKKEYRGSNVVDTLQDRYHKSTPTLYGGVTVDYSPTNRINLFASMYYYTNQTIETNKVDVSNKLGAASMYKVAAKASVNFKVTFKVWDESSIYLNARNFFNNNRKEFAYTDEIGGTYLVGVNFNF